MLETTMRSAVKTIVFAWCVTTLLLTTMPANATHKTALPLAKTTITEPEWQTYTSRFVDASGRVVDVEKDGVSHSEGQGYGLLLSVYANDRTAFDRILSFTFKQMRGRSDGLISWIWNPYEYPRITDTNNASDGDVLIAYALIKAAVKWQDAGYVALAEPLVQAIGRHLLFEHDGMVLLKPAAFGFDRAHHRDGPVVNLSYFVYGAFPLFAQIDDRFPWIEAWQGGLMLTIKALAGREALAPDWITLADGRFAEPAEGFAKKSSYDAVRIPLYMLLGGRVPVEYLAPFDDAWNLRGNGAPLDYDLQHDRKIMDMNDLGYRAIAALTACAVRGRPLPMGLQRYRNTTYFSSSLHLLALAAARAHFPHCASGAPEPEAVASATYRGAARLAAAETERTTYFAMGSAYR